MSSTLQEHQIISMELSTIINTYIKSRQGSCRVFHAPFDVKLSDAPLTIVQPDLMNLCNFSKLFYYKNYGVGEYWIVDLRRKIITVNDFEKDIINVQYSFDSTVKVDIYDDLYIDFADVAKIPKNTKMLI